MREVSRASCIPFHSHQKNFDSHVRHKIASNWISPQLFNFSRHFRQGIDPIERIPFPTCHRSQNIEFDRLCNVHRIRRSTFRQSPWETSKIRKWILFSLEKNDFPGNFERNVSANGGQNKPWNLITFVFRSQLCCHDEKHSTISRCSLVRCVSKYECGHSIKNKTNFLCALNEQTRQTPNVFCTRSECKWENSLKVRVQVTFAAFAIV